MCGQREDAEEVVQETLLRVFEKVRQLREPDHFTMWLFQIAKNACLMKRRKSIFAPELELSLDGLRATLARDRKATTLDVEDWLASEEDLALEIPDWSTLPESLALDSELRGLLSKAIHELPGIYQSVVLLRDVQGLTTAEAADILVVSHDTIKTRLHRARLALRNHLAPSFHEHLPLQTSIPQTQFRAAGDKNKDCDRSKSGRADVTLRGV